MGIKQELLDRIHEKAKSKNDGCYRLGNVAYRVRNRRVTHCSVFGSIYEFSSGFMVHTGDYKWNGCSGGAQAQRVLEEI